ncbi:MAG: SDR family oxidoreductase [Chloroflexi bacterium]|nr:SDR family oxidoreductase [Chloroflexota bacterium]
MILGASSGFGGATALELARNGYDIFGVHLDRRATMSNVERIQAAIRECGREAWFFNVNAADPERIKAVITEMKAKGSDSPVRVLLHSLAFGSLRPLVAANAAEQIEQKQMDMTLDVMANSLIYWVQELGQAGLLGKGSRVFAMTSAGSTRVWPTYGPVSAAKAALESYIRQLAYELAPKGITVNAIRAGVTDTPALRKIPGNVELLEGARRRNPSGRLTTPEDIAQAIVVLADPRTHWITGNVIGVDGGEDIVG